MVCLEASPETIFERLSAERDRSAGPVVRPMLAGEDPLRRIRELKAERQPSYSLANWAVQTDRLSPEQAASEVARAWGLLAAVDAGTHDEDLAAVVRTSAGDYPVWVGWGLLDDIGEKAAAAASPGAAYVVTDEGAYLHGRRAQTSLETAGVPCHIFVLQQGEAGKTLDGAARIYEWLASLKAERGHLVAAVGGGVVGDMAGFAAATYLRGMPLAQVPTTMLAMMDAAVGGKTGVDLPYGKNLVGAFHQPRLVLADVAVLKTLPERELNSGWAEAIKHGLILDAGLFEDFESRGEAVRSLDPAMTIDIVRRSVAVKADVVTRDEKERLGLRVLLNYGHTVGPRHRGRDRLHEVPARRGGEHRYDRRREDRPGAGHDVGGRDGEAAPRARGLPAARVAGRRGLRRPEGGNDPGQEDRRRRDPVGAAGRHRAGRDARQRAGSRRGHGARVAGREKLTWTRSGSTSS